MKQIMRNCILGIGFGICVFVLHFLMIPLLCRGWPDFMWIALMILIPSVLTWIFYRKYSGLSMIAVFPAVLVQYLLLILLAGPVSKLWGSSVSRVLGWFEYIGQTFAWPIASAATQALTMWTMKKMKK